MRYLNKTFCIILSAVFISFSLMGCSNKTVTCPFTEITWDKTAEDVIAYEGENYTEGISNYKGDCYVYPKQYKDLDGSIQYMFDEEGQLGSVTWQTTFETADEVTDFYNQLNEELTDSYGKSGFDSDLYADLGGNVWYQKDGNIILMKSTVNEFLGIQLTYVSPDHSVEE